MIGITPFPRVMADWSLTVAALVLFNARATFRTGLRVGQNPVGRFRLVAALFGP